MEGMLTGREVQGKVRGEDPAFSTVSLWQLHRIWGGPILERMCLGFQPHCILA